MSLPTFPSRFEQVELLHSTPLERSYRAFDRLMQREVVLRLPATEAWTGWNLDARSRLVREAQSLGKVQHDGVLPVLWMDETSEGLLVVQPPTTGEKLSDHIKQGPMAIDAVIKLGIEVGEALAAVHYAGIVHRGIGADAVWIQPNGKARLGAFTYAKAFDGKLGPSSLNHGVRNKQGASNDAALLPPYPAPEQLAGRPADPRVDVFALGCLLFRCLAGHDPLLSGDGGQMPDVRAARKDVPKALGEVIRRCMLVERTARYPTAQAVVDALKPLVVAEGGAAVAGGGVSRRAWMAAAGAVGMGAIALAVWPKSESVPLRDEGPQSQNSNVSPPGEAYKPTYGKGHALLIGVGSAYADSGHFAKLNGPETEVKRVAEALVKLDPVTWSSDRIKVLTGREPTGQAVLEEIQRLKRVVDKDDAVLIYFAGHGVQGDNEETYHLVCADPSGKDPNQQGARGFIARAQVIFTGKGAFRSKHVLLIADCCHSGQLFATHRSAGQPLQHPDSSPNRKSKYLERRAVEFLGSSGSEEAKDCAPGGVSMFCRLFLEGLTTHAEQKKPVTAQTLWASIRDRMEATPQTPVHERSEGGHEAAFTFFFGAQ
jgi:hypothetical protein